MFFKFGNCKGSVILLIIEPHQQNVFVKLNRLRHEFVAIVEVLSSFWKWKMVRTPQLMRRKHRRRFLFYQRLVMQAKLVNCFVEGFRWYWFNLILLSDTLIGGNWLEVGGGGGLTSFLWAFVCGSLNKWFVYNLRLFLFYVFPQLQELGCLWHKVNWHLNMPVKSILRTEYSS